MTPVIPVITEKATIHYKDGTSRVLARPKGSQRFYMLDDEGEPTTAYRTRRTLDEWPKRDQRCARVEFAPNLNTKGKS